VDELGDVSQTPTRVGGPYQATLQIHRGSNRDSGTGGHAAAEALIFIEKRANVAMNQLVEIKTGPNAGTWWEVLLVFEPSRSRWHKELKVTTYIGKTP
jgi:hypothetical protein